MPTPPKKAPDRHYDFRSTNVVFAWSVLVMLAVTIWMMVDDYAKPWKQLQSRFRTLEREKLAAEAEAERQKLSQDGIAQIQQDIERQEELLSEKSGKVEELEDRLGGLGKKIYEADAASRTTKSLLDTARYRFDQAVQGGGQSTIDKAKSYVAKLDSQLREEKKTLEAFREQELAARQELAELRSGRTDAEERLAALNKGLLSLETRVANLDKSLDYFLLNAPLMDFVQPPLKIEQVVLPGLYHDINFTKIERVDRCVTCHVASPRPGFDAEEWQEPFRTHPRLDLFVGASSPHPYSRFGCTGCHGGLDRATDFARAGHSPSNPDEKHEWESKWGWEKQPFLETPILPAEYSEAGCLSCHASAVWSLGADRLEVGRELISRTGCFGCHKLDYPAFAELGKPGPSLRKVASKNSPEWAYKWIEAPREFRPTTWMPHFFFLENVQGDLNLERQRAEIKAIVAYLWDRSEVVDYPPAPTGNASNGQRLFETVGCTGCHVIDADGKRDDYFPQFNRLHGPNLVRAGSKVSGGWLYAWIKDPKQFNPDTRMPSLRLTNREAADITSYLMSSRDPAFEDLSMPDVNAEVRDDLVRHYLENTQTIEGAQASMDAMGPQERDVFLGHQTIQKYGCFSCHDIDGFDDIKPIGVELTEEGSKPIHQFDFGHRHDVPHTRQDWIKTKLLEPRSWDRGKEAVKRYEELYRMPDFGLSEREAEAVVANVLGFTEESVLASRRAGTGSETDAVAAGRSLITRYNCQGCHLIEGKGRAIRTSIEDVGLLPPNLAAEGARVQSDWLFEYLHDPGSVSMRPWLGVRMPTFGFRDDQANSIVSYFAARDQREAFMSEPGPADARDRAVGKVVFGMLQCIKCHPTGPQGAIADGADGTGGGTQAADLAPSLLLAKERLRHDWVPHWIKDPQSWVTGTNMPSNFAKRADGSYDSPLVNAIDAPMFSAQKATMRRHFSSEQELKEYLSDVDKVTAALRDHIWTLE